MGTSSRENSTSQQTPAIQSYTLEEFVELLPVSQRIHTNEVVSSIKKYSNGILMAWGAKQTEDIQKVIQQISDLTSSVGLEMSNLKIPSDNISWDFWDIEELEWNDWINLDEHLNLTLSSAQILEQTGKTKNG